jgi:hypothetical protein
MTDSPNLGLPLMEAAQAQKHVTHNEALVLLDAILQIAVADMAANTPPSSPSAGARVVVGPAATGAFVGQTGKIAYFDNAAWRFFQPGNGWIVWSTVDAALYIYTGAAWVKFTDSLGAIQNLGMLGVGAAADATNPLSVRAGNALFSARYVTDGGDGSLRFKLNKENVGASVSQLYQTNWSGRAETGLMGNDLWSVRRSADGVTWTTPLSVDTAQVRVLDGSATVPGIGFAAATGTGFSRASDGTFCATVGGVEVWRGSTAGVFSVSSSAVVGDNSGNRGRLTIGVGLSNGLYFGSRGSIGALLDGVFVMRDNAGSSFGRLAFGGSTAGFPSLKRSAANVQVRLADDSAFAGLECSFVRPASFTVATAPSASALGAGATIYVSNESGGAVIAFSDGAAWRRVTDRAIIS